MMEKAQTIQKRVLVIGGGVSGMHAVRQFSSSEAFHVVCMEQLSVVGGLWNYSDVITDENHPTGSKYTAIYKNLKTNIPTLLMGFSELPYPEHLPSYIDHHEVKKYLWNCAKTYNLHQYIKFNTRVLSVRPKVVVGHEDTWQVDSMDVFSKQTETSEFDIVIVCSGICSKANIPVVRGMRDFAGRTMHSQEYRRPEDFRDKQVVVVGAGPSGIDISMDLQTCARKVWFSNKGPNKKSIPDSIQQVGEIVKITRKNVILKKWEETNVQDIDRLDKSVRKEDHVDVDEKVSDVLGTTNDSNSDVITVENVDVIMFCTGFSYSFPFLNADCGFSVITSRVVSPLYKDTICLGRQSLSFIGLHIYGTTLLFEHQAKFLKAFYEGKFKIPAYGKELLELVEEDNEKKRCNDVNVYHKPLCIPFYQFDLMNELATLAGFEKVSEKYRKFFKDLEVQRTHSQQNYKTIEYELGADGFFIEKNKDPLVK